MKKLFYFLFVVITLTSCSSDESNDSNLDVDIAREDLIGVWDLVAMTSDLTAKATLSGQSVTSEYETYGKDIEFTYEFKDNPNEVTASGSYIHVVTITTLGNSQTQEIPTNSIDGLGQGTWEESNGVITITSDGNAQEAFIESYTNNTLKLKIPVDETTTQQGAQIDFNGEVYLTLQKQ